MEGMAVLELISSSAIEFGDITSHEALLSTFLAQQGGGAPGYGPADAAGPDESSPSSWAKFRASQQQHRNSAGGLANRSRPSSLISATLYTLNPRAGPINPKPFHDAVVRITRRSVSVYRSYDRAFLIEILFADIRDVEQHVPPEAPHMHELAFVHARGILVLDVAVPSIASGILTCIDTLVKCTTDQVSNLLQLELSQQHADEPYAAPPFVSRHAPAADATHLSFSREASSNAQNSPAPHQRIGSVQRQANPRLSSSSPSAMKRQEEEEIDRIRRREQEIRREISLPSRSASTISSSHTAAPVGGAAVDPRVLKRRQEAAAQRQSRSSSRSTAQPQSGPTEDIIHKVERQLREDSIMREAAVRSSSMASRREASVATSSGGGASPSLGHIGGGTSGHHRRDEIVSEMATLLAQLEREEREAERAALAQRNRLAAAAATAAAKSKVVAVVAPAPSPARPPTRFDDIVSPGDEQRQHDHASISAGLSQRAGPPAPQQLSRPPLSSSRPAAMDDAEGRQHQSDAHRSTTGLQGASTDSSPPPPSGASEWQARKDPSSGRTYYFNPKTKRTTWQVSETDLAATATATSAAGSSLAASPPTTGKSDSLPQPLAEGWKEVLDGKGKPYYFHRETKRTTRNRSEAETALVPAASIAPPSGSNEKKEDSHHNENMSTIAHHQVAHAASGGETKKADDASNAASMRTNGRTSAPAADAHQSSLTNLPTRAATKEATNHVDPAAVSGASTSTAIITSIKPTAAEQHPSEVDEHLIVDPDQTRRENELRKAALEKKKEEDKSKISVGGMSMMEALQRAQEEAAASERTVKKLPKGPPPLVTAASDGGSKEGNPSSQPPTAVQAMHEAVPAVVASSSAGKDDVTKTPQSMKPAGAAPGGTIFGSWKECFSKEHQRTFYKNVVTSETTWTEPDEVKAAKAQIAAKEKEASAGGPRVAPPPPPPPPQAASSKSAASQPSTGAGGAVGGPSTMMYGPWKEIFNDEKQKFFYKNTATGESTWKVPPEVAAAKVAAPSSASPAREASSTSTAASSPPRVLGIWKELFDANKGKCYYVNTETKERTWDVSKTSFAGAS